MSLWLCNTCVNTHQSHISRHSRFVHAARCILSSFMCGCAGGQRPSGMCTCVTRRVLQPSGTNLVNERFLSLRLIQATATHTYSACEVTCKTHDLILAGRTAQPHTHTHTPKQAYGVGISQDFAECLQRFMRYFLYYNYYYC